MFPTSLSIQRTFVDENRTGHITFGDPDFFNGPGHVIPIVEKMHHLWPHLTYDVTIKIEHLLKYQRWLPLLRDTGRKLVRFRLPQGATKADVEKAELDTHDMEYLYSDASGHHFMNTETYDQLSLSDEALGDSLGYMLPETVITVDFYESEPIAVELPISADQVLLVPNDRLCGSNRTASVSGKAGC